MSWGEDGLYRLHPISGPRANGVMRRITEGIEPYAAPRVTTAIVGTRRVTGAAAASYASLFTSGEPTQLDARPYDWVTVDLRANRPSPWTDGFYLSSRNPARKKPLSPPVLRVWDEPKTARLRGSCRLPRAFLHL